MGRLPVNPQEVINTARTLVAGDKGLLAMDESNPTCNKVREFGEPAYDRVEGPATPAQKELLAKLSPEQVKHTELAGETIQTVLTHAPGDGAPIDGLKVVAQSGCFAARPPGTEGIYKIYAESFRGRIRIICTASWRKPRPSSVKH